MKRREQREVIFRLVFCIPFYSKEEMEEQTAFFLARMKAQDEDYLPEAAKNLRPVKRTMDAAADTSAAETAAADTSAADKSAADTAVVFGELDEEYVLREVNGILENLPAIDSGIESKSKGWELDRFGRAELAILRVAAYEIMYDDEIPPSVAVNEAVEMTKKYCDEKARAFVNGVLSGMVKELTNAENESDAETK